MSQNQLDVARNEFVTVYLLDQSQVESEVYATIDLFQSTLATRINAFFNYLRITTRANYLVSALNTNFLVGAKIYSSIIESLGVAVAYGPWSISQTDVSSYLRCSTANPTSSVGFLSVSYTLYLSHSQWEEPPLSSSLVSGFYAGCTPLEALLRSTLDCLYNIDCLQLLSDRFSLQNQVRMMMFYITFLS